MPDRSTETTSGEKRRRAGLLARERTGDKTVLWRVGAWSGVAVASVAVALVVAGSPTGVRHGALVQANSLITEQSRQIQQFAQSSEREARRLAGAIETLNADRNRLFKRMTDLEHNLDTVTGSIERMAAAPTPPLPAPPASPPPADVAVPATQPAAGLAAPEPSRPEVTGTAPTAALPAGTDTGRDAAVAAPGTGAAPPPAQARPAEAAAGAGRPKIEVVRIEPAKGEPIRAEIAKPEPTKPETAKSAKAEPAKVEPAKAETAKAAVPTKPEAKPGPADATARADTALLEATDDEPTGSVQQTEFGVDLGHASSVEGLRAIWAATRKMHGALVDELQPVITIREPGNGVGMQLRVVAGPMTDAAAAARLCARIGADDRPCRTAVYDGQRLVMRADPGAEPEAASSKRPAKSVKSARPERSRPKAEAKQQQQPQQQPRLFPFLSQQQQQQP